MRRLTEWTTGIALCAALGLCGPLGSVTARAETASPTPAPTQTTSASPAPASELPSSSPSSPSVQPTASANSPAATSSASPTPVTRAAVDPVTDPYPGPFLPNVEPPEWLPDTARVARAVMITSATSTSADALGTVTITGRISPDQSAPVALQYLSGTTWRNWTSVTTDAQGNFRFVVNRNPGRIETQQWRVLWPGTEDLVSPVVTVKRVAVLNLTQRAVTAADVPKTYRAGCPVGPSQLTRIEFTHYGFDGLVHRGYWIVRTSYVAKFRNVAAVQLSSKFPIRMAKDPSPFGTDEVSMRNDNSYAFFCRQVVGNPYARSPHSYGHAIDINPYENPYLTPGGVWLPSTTYVSRSVTKPGMLHSSTPLVKAFIGQGFDWYSGWDWQHFQVK